MSCTIITFPTKRVNMFARQLSARLRSSIDLPISAGRKRHTERGQGGCFVLEVAVSVETHCWQLHTISPRAADLLLRTMEPRAQWNLGVRPASRSSACSCARSRETSLPLQLAPHFSCNNEKLVYYQLLWQSFWLGKKIGVRFWRLLFICV